MFEAYQVAVVLQPQGAFFRMRCTLEELPGASGAVQRLVMMDHDPVMHNGHAGGRDQVVAVKLLPTRMMS